MTHFFKDVKITKSTTADSREVYQVRVSTPDSEVVHLVKARNAVNAGNLVRVGYGWQGCEITSVTVL